MALGIIFMILAVASFVMPSLDLLPKEVALAGVVFLVLGGAFGGSGLYIKARNAREERIRREGIPGMAKVINWWIVGKSGGSMSTVESCRFELEVAIEGQAPYIVKHRQLVPWRVYSQIGKGTCLPVKVDPQNPRRVVLAWDEARGPTIGGDVSLAEVAEMMRQAPQADEKGALKERLRQLEEAYREGLTSAEEYESKRAKVLEEL